MISPQLNPEENPVTETNEFRLPSAVKPKAYRLSLEPDLDTKELVLTHLHPGVTAEQAREATGWELRIAEDLRTTEPPSDDELSKLRELVAA